MFRIFLLVFLYLSLVSFSFASETHGWFNGVVQHDGLQRQFRYYLPKDLPDSAPLVILLHGGKRNMDKLFRRFSGGSKEWPLLAEDEKFILMVPNGVNARTQKARGGSRNWNDCRIALKKGMASDADDVGFIKKLLIWSQNHLSINVQRIYLSGASNGGLMSYRLATELPDAFAAVAVFIANGAAKGECLQATQAVPIMIVNATQDPLMPWAGGEVKGGGGRVLSAEATLEYWLKVNKVKRDLGERVSLPDLNKNDDSRVVKRLYPASKAGEEVWFYALKGAGHVSPSIKHEVPKWIQRALLGKQNKDMEGAAEAWRFFQRH
ncbi:MAG: PHB depolymerase family esterase [Gammaproteobacteria bacterium]|nr:PHB depolymerase family esterase [Gammaproteobacteria bacterium]